MTETISSAVAKRDTGPGAMIKQYSTDFTQVLPSHINGDTWIRLAQGVLRRDKNLARIAAANPGSLMQALMECARLGHEPGTDSFYLIPMGGEIEGWEGYKGVIERMYRAGAVVSVKAELVKENDVFNFTPADMDRPDHRVEWFSERGKILGAYSYAEMQNGTTSKVVIINQQYIAQVKAMSKGSSSASSPWTKWPDQMVLKTVLHRLEPFVPTSSEYREELRRDAAAGKSRPPGSLPVSRPTQPHPIADVSHLSELRDDDPDLVDAEIVDEGGR